MFCLLHQPYSRGKDKSWRTATGPASSWPHIYPTEQWVLQKPNGHDDNDDSHYKYRNKYPKLWNQTSQAGPLVRVIICMEGV